MRAQARLPVCQPRRAGRTPVLRCQSRELLQRVICKFCASVLFVIKGVVVSLPKRRGACVPSWGPGAATWGHTISDPGRVLCLPVRDVAQGILNKAYRKVLDQLSARKYLQTLLAKGLG